MWLERSASIIEPRISRATMAICGSASVITGRADLVAKPPPPQPAAGTQSSISREDQLVERRDDEGRDGAADRRVAMTA